MNGDCQALAEEAAIDEAAEPPDETAGQDGRLAQTHPVIWVGDLFLKNYEVRIELRYVYGDLAVFRTALPYYTDPRIYVRKKLKFDESSQYYVQEKLERKSGRCVLIALPLGSNATQWKRLQKQFIHYFNQKQIMGVSEISRDAESETKYEALLLPPSAFLRRNLSSEVPILMNHLYRGQTPHLTIVIS